VGEQTKEWGPGGRYSSCFGRCSSSNLLAQKACQLVLQRDMTGCHAAIGSTRHLRFTACDTSWTNLKLAPELYSFVKLKELH